ncbi:dentin sialophosphoprotein-like [Hylaeus volcanicus]|uniref:dentin sialophosphoprotein-like n=1 Tax=Hylaeus volcanicus TaxID=313075 RepID=UPI0023B8133E|nr:dentin sialophosphoprotein-like [Hylaeus volcanicus]
MSSVKNSRSCCVCNKLFCCEKCCERHKKSKHSSQELSCPLCTSQKLSILGLFDDKLLLYHVQIAHLPLYCRLCGKIFSRIENLESFGTCKWWTSRHRHSLVFDKKSIPVSSDGKESPINAECNGKFKSLTSPPELYRNTSTPMVVGQKSNLDFKTPNVPNFSFKTPKTNSVSLVKQIRSDSQDSSNSTYLSFAISANHEETSFRSVSSNRKDKDDRRTSNSEIRKLDIMKEKEEKVHSKPTYRIGNNNDVEDMELTSLVGEIVFPDSQSLEMCVQTEKRSDSLKKVRFSDQYDTLPGQSSMANNPFNATENENEEYFEACDTLSGTKEPLKNPQIKIHEEQSTEKENYSPNRRDMKVNQQQQQPSGSSRVVMMVVMENNSTLSTSDLIDSGLKKFEQFASEAYVSANSRSSPDCNSSFSYNCYATTPSQVVSPIRRDSSTSSNGSSESSSSSGLFSAVANAVRTVMKNLSGVGSSRNIENEQISRQEDIIPRPSTGETFDSVSSCLASSLLRRPGKRPRDTLENASSSQRPIDVIVPQVEFKSPLAKRHRGRYRIKGREPIARMRNNRLTSPRGVSSETQVFHQGSLSVGDTVLPLPSRAHQSTQTE